MTIQTTPGLHLVKNFDGKGYTVKGVGRFKGGELCVGVCEDGLPVTAIADGAFREKAVERFIAGDCVQTIGEKAFLWSACLKSVALHGTCNIEWLAFAKCKSLTELYLGEGLERIGDSAFEECSSLTSVMIPKSVKEIGSHAFCGCPLKEALFLRPEGWTGDNASELQDKAQAAYRLSNRNAYSLTRE